MREKKRCRWLALLLAVVMLLSVLPTAVFAADTAADDFIRIFHLDCGRKYFEVDQVKNIIDKMAAKHYTHLELAFGNDGLRFVLDDMSFTANGTTYSHDAVVASIKTGNASLKNSEQTYWTETDMESILSYAAGKGIEIIPLLNLPGHANTILDIASDAYNYSDGSKSQNTLDVTNEAAVNFAYALFRKYVDYFADKGCKLFNFGADEFANDIYSETSSKGLSFQAIYDTDTYKVSFVSFINKLADYVKTKGMTPMAFNDGLYYSGNKSTAAEVEIDKSIICCYWTTGWNAYHPAAANLIAAKGHKIISTNDAWYWVLGRQTGTYGLNSNKVASVACTNVPGDDDVTVSGCMMCLWCDDAASYNSTNQTNLENLISTFATSNPTYFVADSGETGPTDPTEPGVTITVSVGQTATATISGANYAGTYTTDDPSIATVEVTGKDATEATTTYTQDSSVTCYDLIRDNADDWTAASGYYYTPDGTNYYPVYAKRSSSGILFWKTYTYTWGYSTTDSADNVTQIGTQSTTDTSTTPNITVYTKSGTDGTPASTTVTFNGLKVGTTYVTVGNTRYTINVVDKAPDDALTGRTLTIVYRITNSTVYTTQSTSSASSVTISSSDATSEAGIAVVDKVPKTAYSDYDGWIELHYWQAMRLDAEHNQSGSGSGADQTGEGTTFTHVRYYNSAWQYMTSDGVWHYFLSGDQAVAYYMRHTQITTEITTAMKDWGYSTDSTTPDTSSNQGQVALTVAVVYPDGTVSPAESNMYAQSTTIFNFSTNWQSSGKARDIGLIVPLNNSDYTISKITVTNGTRTDNTNSNTWASSATISWDKVQNEEAGSEWYDETIYWQELDGGTPMINGATQNIRWSAKNTAKLVLIYLKPIHYDTNLTVNWVDDSASGALISTMEVAVSSDGTPITFYNGLKQTSALPEVGVGGTFTLDNDAYVTNSSNVNQTFNKNISTVPDVADKYKTGLYQYVSADLSADGMTLTLHYNVKADKTFVYDFGLPMQVKLNELLNNADAVGNISFDSSEVKYENNVVTFTPSSAAVSTITTKATITFVDDTTQTMTFAFVPASNVLYEENFMEPVEGSYVDWTHTEKSVSAFTYDADTVYGYTSAYANCTGANGQYTASVAKNNSTDDLKFTFTGTGFDLIAQCGASTGTLMVRVDDENGNYVKSYLVDTSFNDSNVGNNLYQVPVIHEQNLKSGTYTVTIFGAYIAYGAASNSNANTASTFSMRSVGSSAIDTIYELAGRMGLSGDDLDSMEFINVDQLYGASTYAMASAVRTASTGTADTESVATMTLGIDGFRVYRDTGNSAYKTGEKDMVYTNVMDDAIRGSLYAYVEAANGTYDVKNYESTGGPQNEIYLPSNSGIVFQLANSSVTTAQVSARAVSGSTKLNGNVITSNTEMYYTVTVENGTITIVNNGSGMLALANIKAVCALSGIAPKAEEATEKVRMMLMAVSVEPEPDPEQPGTEEPEPTPVFTPETFKTRVNSIRTRNRKIVTLTITASTDVDHVVVNGKTYYPMNKLLVKWGLSKTYVFTIMDTAGASETRSFEIVAYNADGLASIIYTDAG